MTGEALGVCRQNQQLFLNAGNDLFGVSAPEIRSSDAVKEERISAEQAVVQKDAHASGSMPGSGDEFGL